MIINTNPLQHITSAKKKRATYGLMIKYFWGTNKSDIFLKCTYHRYISLYTTYVDTFMLDIGSRKDKAQSWDTEPEINLFPHS